MSSPKLSPPPSLAEEVCDVDCCVRAECVDVVECGDIPRDPLQPLLLLRCDNPNFVVELLMRKLAVVGGRILGDERCSGGACSDEHSAWTRAALLALGTLYVVDSHGWMVCDVRQRLWNVMRDSYMRLFMTEPTQEFTATAQQIISANIIHGDPISLTTLSGQQECSLMLSEWSASSDSQDSPEVPNISNTPSGWLCQQSYPLADVLRH